MLSHLLLMAALLAAPPVAGTGTDPAQQIRALVRNLAADTKEQRDGAEKAILELGPPALDVLPPINEQMPAEMQQRLARVRVALEQQRATSVSDASRVTLATEGLPLADVFKRIEKATGNRIVDRRPESARTAAAHPPALRFENARFWEAVDQLLDAYELDVDPSATSEAGQPLRAVAVKTANKWRGSRAKRANYSGAFRFEPVSIVGHRGPADKTDTGLDLTIGATWEPRMTPITLSFPLGSVTATLENGQPLQVVRAGTETMAVLGTDVRFTVPLALPPSGSRSLKLVKGDLTALVPGGLETFRFGPLAADKTYSQRKGSVAVRVDSVRRNAENWEIGVSLKFDDAAGALQSHLLSWIDSNEVWLEQPDGTRIDFIRREPTREKESESGALYVFPLAGDIRGSKLVYRTPAAVVQRAIPFELKDIALP